MMIHTRIDRERADRAIDEIIAGPQKTDAELIADAHTGISLLMSAIDYNRKRHPFDYSDANVLMNQKITDLNDLIEGVGRRLPKLPSLWTRFKKWANLPTNGRDSFADGGFITSKQPVADWFRAQPKPEPPPIYRKWTFSTQEAAVQASIILMSRAITCNGEIVGFLPLVPKPPLGATKTFTIISERERFHREVKDARAARDQFNDNIPCWLFPGNVESIIKQWQYFRSTHDRAARDRALMATICDPKYDDAKVAVGWSVSQDGIKWVGATKLSGPPDDPNDMDLWRTAKLRNGEAVGVKFWRKL